MPSKSAKAKNPIADSANPPRMVGAFDVEFIESIAEGLAATDKVVEFGPWLGAFSIKLAEKADLHVVDNFVWTADHDRRVPGLVAPGDSFRPALHDILASQGLSATYHETDFQDFEWTSGEISLCVIDSPKDAAALQVCLRAVHGALRKDGIVAVKNGTNPKFGEMLGYIDNLVRHGVFEVDSRRTHPKSNIIVLRRGENIADFAEVPLEARESGPAAGPSALAGKGPFQLARIVKEVNAGRWQQAYEILASMKPDRELKVAWDKLEPELGRAREANPDQFGTFSEILALHNDKASYRRPMTHFHGSSAMTLKAFWLNNADKPWRGRAFCPEILVRAYEFGYMNWPSKVRDHVRGRDVLDIGCGPGLHGLGYLTAGAKSYVGMDPIVKPDADRVKNLTQRNKMGFGWSPNEISDRIEPWNISPTPIGDYDPARAFDIATLHNVTEHLHGIEGIFADIAKRLRPGGVLLYNHHNFYAWNGHHLPPKTVSAIDPSDPSQAEMLDWGHVEYDPAPEHYIARGLNRIRLDEIIELTEKYFEIETAEEIPSRPETGLGRLTDKIRKRYPNLTDRDFETQNLLCVARVRG